MFLTRLKEKTAVILGAVLLAVFCAGFTFEPEQREFLDEVQKKSLEFFLREHHPRTGLVKDKAANFIPADTTNMASIAATGFGLTAMCAAAERGWIPRQEAYDYALKTLRFFHDDMDQVKGFFYHFVDWRNGLPANNTELSSIDTALFLAGALTAAEYFKGTEVETLANQIYARVDFPWMMNGGKTLSMGWMPRDGFLKHRWDSYNESLILYVLAAGSPTHPIPGSAWKKVHKKIGVYGEYRLIQCPPLFTHQYSQVWLDLRDKNDGFADYFENSTAATLVNHQFCVDQSNKFKTYSADIWGLTASESPDGYKAYGAEPGGAVHDGTIAPTAAGSSIVFTPELSYQALRAMRDRLGSKIWGKYGFSDAFNLHRDWYAQNVLGIDQGPLLLMIENQRSEFVWKTFMSHPAAQKGMKALGFREGTIELQIPERPEIIIPKSKREIIIDARLKEWARVPRAEILPGEHMDNGEVKDNKDLSALISFQWDEDDLYLAAQVKDDSPGVRHGKASIWKDDILEIFVDPLNDMLEWNSPEDIQLGLSPGRKGSGVRSWAWFQGYDPQETGLLEVKVRRINGGYILEARIAWDLLGATPEPGFEFGLTPAIHDLDEADRSEGKLSLHFLKEGKSGRFELALARLE